MFQNLCAGAVGLLLMTRMKFGCLKYEKLSNFATGVARSLTRTKGAKYGLPARGPSHWINKSMALGFELYLTIRGKLVLRKSQEWEIASVKLSQGNQIRQRMQLVTCMEFSVRIKTPSNLPINPTVE